MILSLIFRRPKENGLTAGAASMDCISPLTIKISVASYSISCLLLDVREGRNISTGISDFFFLNKTFLKNNITGLLRSYSQVIILQRKYIQVSEYCAS